MALSLDRATLEAALVGYQQQLATIEMKMADLRRKLGQRAPAASSPAQPATSKKASPRKHRMSAEGRARIAAAQRARWAKQKKGSKTT